MLAYVKNADGPVAGFATNAQVNEAIVDLQDGETLVLLADIYINTEEALNNRYAFDEPAEIGIDLNGNTVYVPEKGSFVGVTRNVTVNVYSSEAGARIYSRYIAGTSTLAGEPIFVIENGTGAASVADRDLVYNAYINVGTFGSNPGSNLLIEGSVIFNGKEGTESTGMTVDGVTVVRVSDYGEAPIITEMFDGSMYFTNSEIIALVSDNLIDLKGYYQTPNKPTQGRKEGFEDVLFTPYVSVIDCKLINNGLANGSNYNLVGNNGDDISVVSLYLENVLTNSRLNPSNYGGRTKLGPGVRCVKQDIGSSSLASGVTTTKAARQYVKLDLADENGVYMFRNPVIKNGEIVDDNFIYALNGGVSAAGLVPTGAKIFSIPALTQGTIEAGDEVSVTFLNLVGGNYRKLSYVVGSCPDISSVTPPAVNLGAVKLVFNGTWENYTDSLTENTTMIPGYDIVATVAGIETSVSLFSDLHVNLFIPVMYEEYIVSVLNGENELTAEAVTVNEKSYLKVTVPVNADSLSDDVVFTLNINDTDYETVVEYSVNMADYAKAILDGEYSDADKKLTYYMVAYAFEADKYFDKHVDAALSAIVNDYKALYAPEEAERNYNALDTSAFAQAFEYVTLNIESKTYYVFKTKDGLEANVTVSVGNTTKRYTCTADDEYLAFGGFEMEDFASDITVTVDGTLNGALVSFTATYNFDSFAQYHVENSELSYKSVACMSLIEALYDFANVAKEYSEAAAE